MFTKVSSVTLCNRKTAPLTFRLTSPAPFAIVEIDPITKDLIKQVNKTEQISLKPQQNALVNMHDSSYFNYWRSTKVDFLSYMDICKGFLQQIFQRHSQVNEKESL